MPASPARSRSSATTPTREQVTDLKKGVVQALIAQEPYQEGVDGVQQAVNAINGKPVKKTVATSLSIITKANLKRMAKAVYQSKC